MTTLLKNNEGNYADVTGIVQVYNDKFYLMPAAGGAITNIEERQYTDAEKVADALAELKLETFFNLDTVVELKTAGTLGATITWTSDNATAAAIADGKLNIVVPDEFTTVKVTATVKSGEVTETKEYSVVLSKLETTLDILKSAYALANGVALAIPSRAYEGLVVEASEYTEADGITIKLVVKGNTDYPITVTLKGESAAAIKAGDTAMITGQIKKDNDGIVILGAPTLDKVSSGGNKLTFDLPLPAESVLHLNLKGSDSNKVVVVDVEGDKVLQIQKDNGGTVGRKQTAVDYYYPALSEGDDTYVMEAALKIAPSDKDTAKHIEVVLMVKDDAGALAKAYCVMFTWKALTAGTPVTIQGQGSVDTADTPVAGLELGEEFFIRMEYTQGADKKGTCDVYINDALVIDNGVSETVANGKDIVCAEIQAYTDYCGTVDIDDYNVYTYASTYTFDQEYENNQVYADLKPWKKPVDQSQNKFEIVTEDGNKYLKATKPGNSTDSKGNPVNTCQMAVDVFDPDNKEPKKVDVAVFSGRLNITRENGSGDFEILLRAEKDDDGVNDPNDAQAKVAEVIITFGAEGAMSAQLYARSGGKASSKVTLAPKQGEWFTFELSYKVVSSSEVVTTLKINGETVLTGNHSCLDPNTATTRTDIKFAEIQAYTAFAGTVLYDDLAVDFKEAAPDWDIPTVGAPAVPTGSYVADIATIGAADNTDFAAEKKTTNGWTAVNSQFLTKGVGERPAVVLNGKVGAEGTFTSPALKNGVSEVSFGYAALDSKQIAFAVDILKDGAIVARDTVYAKVTKGQAYTYKWVLDPAIGGDFQIQVTNLALGEATTDTELIAIFDLSYKVAKLPDFAEFDFSTNSWTNINKVDGMTIADGVLKLDKTIIGKTPAFKIPNASDGNVYANAIGQYKFSAKINMNSATVSGGDKNIAFVGFVNATGSWGNGKMSKWGYLTLVVDAESKVTGYKLYGYTFELAKTYDVDLVYTVGSGKYEVYVDGELVSTFTASGTSGIADTTLQGFSMYFRAGSYSGLTDIDMTFDDVRIEVASNATGDTDGRNGVSKYADKAVNFNDRDNDTIKGGTLTGATGKQGGEIYVDSNWNTIVGNVGQDKYLAYGHTGKSSTTVTFTGVTVENDTNYTEDTYVYEFDFMYNQAFNPDNWQGKFQFSGKDMNMTFNYVPATEGTPAVPGTDAVVDEQGNVITPAVPEVPAVPGTPAGFTFAGKQWDCETWYTIRIEFTKGDEVKGKNDSTVTAHKVSFKVYVNDELASEGQLWGTFTETAATETAPATSTPNFCWENLDNTIRFNTRARCEKVDLAIDNVYVGFHKGVPAPVEPEDPETGDGTEEGGTTEGGENTETGSGSESGSGEVVKPGADGLKPGTGTGGIPLNPGTGGEIVKP